MLNKDEILIKMKKQLDEFRAEIDALEVRAHAVKEDPGVNHEEQLVALRAKRREGEKQLEET